MIHQVDWTQMGLKFTGVSGANFGSVSEGVWGWYKLGIFCILVLHEVSIKYSTYHVSHQTYFYEILSTVS